ncbi:MAG: FAD-dependent oxidoreductase [Chloroflexi bacterium]|nr:FAD-dependent oxidoreductase [Chloroflexota bacterium]
MKRVVVVGGGFAGCSAAVTAARAGAQTILIERKNTLSGLGPWTGHIVTWVARQETKLLGGGGKDVLEALESVTIHEGSALGAPAHVIAFDATRSDALMEQVVSEGGVEIIFKRRVVDVVRDGEQVTAVTLDDGTRIPGDAFVDATGKGGGIDVCEKYGQGCVVCMVQCPMWGDRVSLSERAGVPDVSTGREASYLGAVLAAMESLSPDVQRKILAGEAGYSYHPLPPEMVNMDVTAYWRRPERPPTTTLFKPNIEILHMPYAKIYRPNMPQALYRRLPGFENIWFVNPMAAGDGQAVQLDGMAPHDNTLKVNGLANLFCAGVRAGRYDAFVECIFTGDLAGYNAARSAHDMPLMELPETTVMGLFLSRINERHTYSDWPLGTATAPASALYREYGLDTADMNRIRARVEAAGLTGIYTRKL